MSVEPPHPKRIRHIDENGNDSRQLITSPYPDTATTDNDAADDDKIRTSSLASPTMRLTGHKGSVYALAFDPLGESLCSGSFDMTCLLWSATGNCENYNVLSGHKNAILDLSWNATSDFIATASADTNLGWYDALTGKRIKRFMDHEGIVNAVDCSKSNIAPLIASASDDTTTRLFDPRVRHATLTIEHSYPITSIALSPDNHTLFSGGIENAIDAHDLRHSGRKLYRMTGHSDTITCLSMNSSGTRLLSHAMDGRLKSWDVRPFVADRTRLVKTFVGGTHNAEKGLLNCAWSGDGSMVTGGSADRVVHIWDEYSGEELYYLPGHVGCVNSVVFHPKENVIASGSSDKTIFVGELAQ